MMLQEYENKEVGGKKEKKELVIKIENLKYENNKLQQEVYSLQRNREINYDLYNMVKAILKQLKLDEIEIDNDKLKEVERFELYVEDSYMKFAKRIKLIDKNKTLKVDEF